MAVIDGVILAAVLATALLGWREGLVRALWGYTGLMAGTTLGMVLTPVLLGRFGLSVWVSMAALLIVGVAAVGVRFLAVGLSRRLRARLGWTPYHAVDRPGGAVFGAVAALGVSWMLGLALAGSSLPSVSAAANGSVVLERLDAARLPLSHLMVRQFTEIGDESTFPRYVDLFTAERIVDVPAPPADVVADPDVVAAASSVWRLYAQQDGITANEGTGFLVAPERLMTAAHVVADNRGVAVVTPDGRLPASVVACDPEQDVAVLDVPGLAGSPLPFGTATGGDPAVVVGFPGDGDLSFGAARVRERLEWQSSDIRGDGRYVHDAYSVRGRIRGGNSGGPLMSPDGAVLGVVVASSRADDDTGYVLTADQVSAALGAGRAGAIGSADRCG